MKVNERIRQYIESNGIKMNFVADKAGIHQKKFYRLINGDTCMGVDEYELICKEGLSLDPSYFFNQNFSENEKSDQDQPA